MKSTRATGQILVFVVVLLLIISITVISISIVAQRNALQVTGNIDYERSYNASQTLLIESIPKVAALELSLLSLTDALPGADCAISEPSGPTFVCGLVDETSPNSSRRNVISIAESRTLDNYPVAKGGYFDVVLQTGGVGFFNDQLNVSWSAGSALDLELTYTDNSGRLRNIKQVVNQAGVLDTAGAANTMQIANLGVVEGSQSINIGINNINRPSLPGGANRFNYLRISPINRSDDITLLTVTPGAVAGSQLPNQVRVLEAFSYETQSASGAAPVIVSQIPKSPQIGVQGLQAFNFAAIKQPLCGNSVIEGGEQCDDGNGSNTDACTNTCRNAVCGDGFIRAGVEQCDGGASCSATCTIIVTPPAPPGPPPPPVCIQPGNACCQGLNCDYCSSQFANSWPQDQFADPGRRNCTPQYPSSVPCCAAFSN